MADEAPVIQTQSCTSSSDRSAGHSTDQQSASSISVEPQLLLERLLTLEIVRVAERAAVSAARLRGQGSEMRAHQAAADAMRRELNTLPIEGIVVIGDGEGNEASALFVGEKVGTEGGPPVDIAANPLEGMTLCAKGMPGAMATIAIAERGTLLSAPDSYMEKIAIGPGYPRGIVDLDATPEENIAALARAKGVEASAITALILDRPRHSGLVAAVRRAGAAVRFITDGDVAGVIYTAEPDATGVDVYMGIGGAPQGVFAAAALRCIGGQMQARLVLDTPAKRERASAMGIADPRKKYTIDEMVRGDCLFAATGVTDGSMLRGVRFGKDIIVTQTVVMRSTTGTVRRIMTQHRSHEKFQFG
jgi:fructose-1,6-bisphosphatase II / sedoheptulose-1,7-bisphosphatase